jgi:hypothetical protein
MGNTRTKRYTDDLYADSADQNRYNVAVGTDYLTGAGVRLRLYGGYGASALRTEQDGVDRDWQVWTAAGEIDRTMSGVLRVSLRGGLQAVEYDNATTESEERPFGELSLVYTLTSGAKLRLGASYEVRDGDISPYATQERTVLVAALNYRVTSLVVFSLKAEYGNGDYDVDTAAVDAAGNPINATAEDGSDRVISASTALRYQLNDNVTMRLEYRFEDWDSDPFLRESFSRNVVGVGCRIQL